MTRINDLTEEDYKALKRYLSSCKLDTSDEGIVSSCETRLTNVLAFYPNITLTDSLFIRMMLGPEGCKALLEGVPGWFKITGKEDGSVAIGFRRDNGRMCKICLLKEVMQNGGFLF